MIKRILRNRSASNASWLIGGRIAQSVLGLLVSMFTARYLGPSNFGLINYASSVVAFFVPIMQLGFNSILVQELTYHSDDEGSIVGTAILTSLISSVLCIVGVFSTYIANPGETATSIVCVLYSVILIFQAIELIQYWFQAKLLSKYTSLVSLTAYIIISIYKIVLLIFRKSIHWFAISYSIDHAIIGFCLLIIYYRLGGQKLKFSSEILKRLFKRSKYYIVSGMMVTVFTQTDKIMIKLMMDDSAVGYYSAAVTCAGLLSFVYSAVIDSMRPIVFKYKQIKDSIKFEQTIVRLYSMVIYMSLFQSLGMTLFSKLIISVLYGEYYTPSVSALSIIVWYTTFAYYGGAKDVWMLAEEKQRYVILLTISGAIANMILNALLIPLLGINGAALASLLTQFTTHIIIPVIIKPLRHNQLLLLKALNPSVLYKMIKNI